MIASPPRTSTVSNPAFRYMPRAKLPSCTLRETRSHPSSSASRSMASSSLAYPHARHSGCFSDGTAPPLPAAFSGHSAFWHALRKPARRHTAADSRADERTGGRTVSRPSSDSEP